MGILRYITFERPPRNSGKTNKYRRSPGVRTNESILYPSPLPPPEGYKSHSLDEGKVLKNSTADKDTFHSDRAVVMVLYSIRNISNSSGTGTGIKEHIMTPAREDTI